MRLVQTILLLGTLGCSAPRVAPRPSSPQIHSTGATLYVVETWEDWLDDGMEITYAFEDRGHTFMMGEQALEIALKSASRGRIAYLADSKWFPLSEGKAFHLFVPLAAPIDEESVPRPKRSTGFELSVTPTFPGDRHFVSLGISLKKVGPLQAKDVEKESRTGGPEILSISIDEGTRTIPLGASLLFNCPRGDGRMTVLILHVATVDESR